MPLTVLFNRQFGNLDGSFLQDLHNLKQDGSLYRQFWREDIDDFRFCRIQFAPEEIVAYVDACTAFDEFLGWIEILDDPTEAINHVSVNSIQERVLEYNRWAENIGNPDQAFCFAAFIGEHLESLMSGNLTNRYEFLSESYNSDRRYLLTEILEMFPNAAQCLESRRGNRSSYRLDQEIDVQDLLYTILKCTFPDVRKEENTRKHAGNSKRIDIVIPRIDTVIEVKFVRDANHAKKVADELKVDFESYHIHEHCNRVIAYVWDPKRFLPDRINFINDLCGLRTKGENSFSVDIFVKP